jgi:hypothetical protein
MYYIHLTLSIFQTVYLCFAFKKYTGISKFQFRALARTMELASRLGGAVVSALATGPKGREFKPGKGDGFLRVIKSAALLPSDGK